MQAKGTLNLFLDAFNQGVPETFVIDPQGVLQYALYHNTAVGRSVGETLRVLDALQTGDNCPVDWKKGQKTLGK